MSADLARLIHTATGALKAAQAGLDQARADLSTAQKSLVRLEAIIQAKVIGALPISERPITEHRRLHKFGRPAKLDTDPELRAFVLARIDRLTFCEIEADITASFPVERRVKRSAIHHWWKRNRHAYDASGKPAT